MKQKSIVISLIVLVSFVLVVFIKKSGDNEKTNKLSSKSQVGMIISEEQKSKSDENMPGAVTTSDKEPKCYFDEVEVGEVKNGYWIEYSGFTGECEWLDITAKRETKDTVSIDLLKEDDNVIIELVGADGAKQTLKEGSNHVIFAKGKSKLMISGNESEGKITMKYDKNSRLNVEQSSMFSWCSGDDSGWIDDNNDTGNTGGFGDIFGNILNREDIHSLKDITDDSIIHKTGAYFDNSQPKKGDHSFEIDYKGFTGLYKWFYMKAKKGATISFEVDGKYSTDTTRIVFVSPSNIITDISDGSKIKLEKGTSRLVLCGYKADGNIKISYDVNENKVVVTRKK